MPDLASAYNYQQSGNRLHIYSGKSLILDAGIQNDYDGTLLDFSDGTTISAVLSSHNIMTVGLTVVGVAPMEISI